MDIQLDTTVSQNWLSLHANIVRKSFTRLIASGVAKCQSACEVQQEGEVQQENRVDEKDGHLARSRGLKIEYKDLKYTVRNRTKPRQELTLLHGVTGALYPGTMAALILDSANYVATEKDTLLQMGPSGSGKTTLLDCLAGRKTIGKVHGIILFGGHIPAQSFLRRFTGYVEQFESLTETLTVYEQLLYTSELKNPQKERLGRKIDRVEQVLQQLALVDCKDLRIGSSLKTSISGGQRKRVNIGLALVTSPKVLFMDEPTTGLDSYTANEVMLVMKSMADSGLTICTASHSPTPCIFDLFESIMLLLRGKIVYSGQSGLTAQSVVYTHRMFKEFFPEGRNAMAYFEETISRQPYSDGDDRAHPADYGPHLPESLLFSSSALLGIIQCTT